MTQKALTLEEVQEAFSGNTVRFSHIRSVYALAEIVEAYNPQFNRKLKQAALYHDIGYAAPFRQTGFHAVDSTIIAKEHGLDEDVIDAILHHTGSWKEAMLLRPDLAHHYGDACRMMNTPLSRALTFCDLHVNLAGTFVSLNERLFDMRTRHSANALLLQNFDYYEATFRKIDAEWKRFMPNHPLPNPMMSHADAPSR